MQKLARMGFLFALGMALVLAPASGCGEDDPEASPLGPSDAGSGGRAGQGGEVPDPGRAVAAEPPGNASECVPDRETFERDVLPILAQRCGGCHGDPTDYGAPFSLTSYDDVVAGTPGNRPSDRLFGELAAGTMPPPGNLRPPPAEHDTLVGWASCGAETPAYPTGLEASRPVFAAPATPPSGAERVELLVDDFAVDAGTVDLYQDFRFEAVVDREVFIRRIGVDIDSSRVVHHVTLHYAGDNQNYLYAWAPGTGAVQFDDGGLRIDSSTQFRVEIHYNNLTGTDVRDSSGIVLWVAEPEGNEYAMLDPATFAIRVPPMSRGTAEVTCVAENDFTIVAGMPHMHEIGDTFLHTITRADSGETETLIELEGWSFDLQFFYSMPVEVNAGDTMTIRCGYLNDKDRTVTGGLGTTDEMCYDFLYVTPRNASVPCGNGFGRGL